MEEMQKYAKDIARWMLSVHKLEIFWMNKKTIMNSAFVWMEKLCRSRRMFTENEGRGG